MYNKKIGDRVFEIANVTLLFLFALVCLFPFYYIFVNSLSSSKAISEGVYLWPKQFTLETYKAIFRTKGLLQSVGISVARTFLGTFLCVAVSSFVAYIFTYKELFLRKYLYKVFILTMYISAGFIPYYLLISKVGLKNNFLVYIIPGAVSAYFIILVKTYIESLPKTLMEAAELDGAGIIGIFTKIIFPLCKPIIACIIVFAAVNQWNVWSDNLYFVTDKNLYTLQYKLYMLLQTNMAEAVRANSSANVGEMLAKKLTPTSLRLAMTFVTVLPVLCVYPVMQKYFVKGIMLGAVKG